ncbi:hypothetical protein [Pseudomonas phage vB_PaeM_RP6]|nr:hypothetical protein [Pseudomonas aeruginosa]WAB56770.1 hypothetical protein [Pseudomonas phage vB_PaeM_RP15]WAB56884.1 hypothetical protein [Pseudomonas phage vB_PaeM_RP6]WAB57395.1 hypothetical protein [Pseudomonas phage vB_PaeM_RP9]WAB57683.1 hypothetical protein [Pseudomonas phage vB_PaeM_RP10]WAB57909.1 hypothetical protein [Pseudomonas phage vB_PaeM_RP12]WAB58086.1 hypothetical protein [Pseudomonas phage vB_PaeM_RP13]WKW88888.1 hypothetical protein LSL4_gp37 [Pseudomonas phage LSL4]
MKEFQKDYEVYQVLTHSLRLASLHELQTLYDTEDLYDLLEYQAAHDEAADIAREIAKLRQQDGN